MNEISKYFDSQSISTYILCPLKFKLYYIDKLGQLYKKQNATISLSETLHKVLSEFFILEEQKRNYTTIINLLNKNWISIGYSTNEEETDYKHRAITWLKNFTQGQSLNIIPRYINEYFRVRIDDFYIIGKIDRIDEIEGGVEIVDYKTSGSVPTQEEFDQDLQSGISAYACWTKLKLFPKKVSQIYLQYNQKITTIKTPQHLELVQKNIINIIKQIRLDDNFVPKPNNSCVWCDFLTVCPEMGMGAKIVKQENLEKEFKEINLKLEKSINDLYLLHRITLDISEFLDSTKLINSIPEFIKGLVDVDKVFVFIYDDEEKEFILKNNSLNKTLDKIFINQEFILQYLKLKEHEIPQSKIFSGNTINFLLPNIELDKDMLFLPLVAREKFLGFVLIEQKTKLKKFNNYSLSLLQNLTSHISLALHNIQLYELAITDGLTKLYIHRYFITRLEQEVRRAKRYGTIFSLLMLDIDYFKKVNDTYGHIVGDKILKKVAKILLSSVRDTDIVCRYGGEEFAIILLEADRFWAEKIADRIRNNVETAEFTALDKKIQITISVGAKEFYEKDTTEDLINKADQMLYLAKMMGRNRVVLYNEDVK